MVSGPWKVSLFSGPSKVPLLSGPWKVPMFNGPWEGSIIWLPMEWKEEAPFSLPILPTINFT